MTISKQWLDEIEAYWASDEGRAYAQWFWSDDNAAKYRPAPAPGHKQELNNGKT